MTKIIASVVKKIPVPGMEFSNQQFHGGLEVEVPDGTSDAELRDRLRHLYALLGEAVDAEIGAAGAGGSDDTGRGSSSGRDGRVIAMPSSRYGDDQGSESRSGGDRDVRMSGGGYAQERDERRDGGWSEGPDRRGDDGRRREWNRGPSSSGGYGGNGRSGGGGGSGRGGPATQAQIKAVFGIAKGQGVERRDLMRRINEQFGVRRVEDLNVREASTLIEELKAS